MIDAQSDAMREQLAPLFARLPEGCPSGEIWVGEGWFDLLLDLDARLAEIDPDYTIAQIKPKLGGLRYYAFSDTAKGFHPIHESPFYRAITAAEVLAHHTCEPCGEPGQQVDDGYQILCASCESARSERKGDNHVTQTHQ